MTSALAPGAPAEAEEAAAAATATGLRQPRQLLTTDSGSEIHEQMESSSKRSESSNEN